jgi:NAD dependent epimerase/dehydratase family enzyme
MADIVMASQRVVPAKALAAGYAFRFGLLEEALANLFVPC